MGWHARNALAKDGLVLAKYIRTVFCFFIESDGAEAENVERPRRFASIHVVRFARPLRRLLLADSPAGVDRHRSAHDPRLFGRSGDRGDCGARAVRAGAGLEESRAPLHLGDARYAASRSALRRLLRSSPRGLSDRSLRGRGRRLRRERRGLLRRNDPRRARIRPDGTARGGALLGAFLSAGDAPHRPAAGLPYGFPYARTPW